LLYRKRPIFDRVKERESGRNKAMTREPFVLEITLTCNRGKQIRERGKGGKERDKKRIKKKERERERERESERASERERERKRASERGSDRGGERERREK
jgi:hypothetical protein